MYATTARRHRGEASAGPVLRWGKYKGRRLGALPWDYLRWLCDDARDLAPSLLLAARQELANRTLRRQAERAAVADRLLPLPEAEPTCVAGVELDGHEAAFLADALRRGELEPFPMWLPVARQMPLLAAWDDYEAGLWAERERQSLLPHGVSA